MPILRVLLILTCVFFASCKAKKAVNTTVNNLVIVPKSTTAFANDVIAQKNTSPFLYYTATANYRDDKLDQDLNIELQAEQNQYVWLNVKVLFVNVARIMLTPDSIRVLDFINRQYISASYSFLNKFTNAPLQFTQMQNLVYGNALFEPNVENLTLDSAASFYLLTTALNLSSQISKHDKKNLKPYYINIVETNKPQNMEVTYANFQIDGHNCWPQDIAIHIKAEKKVDCTFSINNIAQVKNKEPQFAVPKSYKVLVY